MGSGLSLRTCLSLGWRPCCPVGYLCRKNFQSPSCLFVLLMSVRVLTLEAGDLLRKAKVLI